MMQSDWLKGCGKMAWLAATFYEQMREGVELDGVIRRNLEGLGYGE